jgi:peptidyl-prolyl cis-trans isomerase SurA
MNVLRKNWLLGLFLVIVLAGVSACGGGEPEGADAPSEAASSAPAGEEDAQAGAESDLGDIPEVVAEVNGEEISRSEFEQAYQAQLQQAMAQSQGQAPDQEQLKKQVADNLVSTELLVQEAEKRDITVSDRDVDKTVQELAAQNGLQSADQFFSAMEQQGMDRDTVDDQIRTQVAIERLIEDEAGVVRASDKEVRALYDQLVAQQEQAGQQGGQQQELPPLKQVRPQLVEQVTSQKESQVAERLLGDLREQGEVVINL